MDVTKFAIPEIIFGRGSLNHAGQCALRLGAKKVFLVSDEGIEEAGWLQLLMDILEKAGIKWVYYPGVTSNPRDFQVEQGAEFVVSRRNRPVARIVPIRESGRKRIGLLAGRPFRMGEGFDAEMSDALGDLFGVPGKERK